MALALLTLAGLAAAAVNTAVCNGKSYTYDELAGYGFIPNDARDSRGDTIGGLGSSIAVKSWTKHLNGSYTGILYGLPDRGWNTEGTLNYQGRLHKYRILFTPQEDATVANPAAPNLAFYYLDTIFISDPTGEPTTGIDPDVRGPYKNFFGVDVSWSDAQAEMTVDVVEAARPTMMCQSGAH